MSEDFGFTNDPKRMEETRAFVAAAAADGWEIKPTYGNESVERAARLTREGFVMQALMRENDKAKGHRWLYEAAVHLWGPDGLAIKPPSEYSFDAIKAATRRCSHCGAQDVDTERYSFAGRCCASCLPEMRKKHEFPGWCD